MLKLKSVEAVNYKRFQKLQLDFPEIANILITGENNDYIGTGSNGAGKSSIPSAITWCLTGNTVEDASNLITSGETFTEVIVKLGNYKIVRTLANSEKLTIYKTTPPLKVYNEIWDRLTKTEKQKNIYDLLGINYLTNAQAFRDFTHSCYFDPDEANIFTSKEIQNADKIKFFTRFFNLDSYDKASKLAKVTYDQLNQKIVELDQKIDTADVYISERKTITLENDDVVNIQDYLSLLEEYLQTSKEDLEKLRQQEAEAKKIIEVSNKKKDIENQINKLLRENEKDLNQIQEYTIKINEVVKKVVTLENTKEKLSDSLDTKLLNIPLDKILDSLQNWNTENRIKATEIKRLTVELSEILSCPKCEANLVYFDDNLELQDDDAKVKINNYVDKLKKEIIQLEKSISDYKIKERAWSTYNSISTLEKEIELKSASINDYDDFRDKIKQNIKSRLDQCKTLELEIVNYNSQLLKFKAIDIDTITMQIKEEQEGYDKALYEIGSTKEIIASIDKLNAQKKNWSKEKKEIAENLGVYKFWQQNFKHLKSIILDNKLKILEQITNNNLKKLEMPFIFYIKSSEETKTTDNLQFKLSIKIKDELGNTRDLSDYSKGEKLRIVAMMSLSLRDILKSNIGFMFFDEYLNMLDDVGENYMSSYLMSYKGQNLVITNSASLQNNWSGNICKVSRKRGKSSAIAIT